MENDQAKRFHWGTALLNSFVTVIAGLFVWMVPAIAKGFQMGFQLGSQGTDQAEIQQQISMTIESMYLDHHATYYMIAGVIMALLVYLYTRKLLKKQVMPWNMALW